MRYGKSFTLVTGGFALAFPAGAYAIAQEIPEREASGLLALLVAWFPIVIFLAFFIWFMRRSGVGRNKAHMERGRAHMDRVEQQNDQIIAALDRIEDSLRGQR